MSALLVLSLILIAAVIICERLKHQLGENAYILISDKRRESGILFAFCWCGGLMVFNVYLADFGGYGPFLFIASNAVAYWVGQIAAIESVLRSIRIETARGEVMAGRFHRTPQAAPASAPKQERAAPQSPPDPAFAFDPSRFS